MFTGDERLGEEFGAGGGAESGIGEGGVGGGSDASVGDGDDSFAGGAGGDDDGTSSLGEDEDDGSMECVTNCGGAETDSCDELGASTEFFRQPASSSSFRLD